MAFISCAIDSLLGHHIEVVQCQKVGSVFPMVIGFESRMGPYRDDHHRDDAPHFIFYRKLSEPEVKNIIDEKIVFC